MKKYAIASGNEKMISEYEITNDNHVLVTFGDGSSRRILLTEKTVSNLDKIMMRQYRDYDNFISMAYTTKEDLISLGAGVATTVACMIASTGAATKGELLLAITMGAGAAFVTNNSLTKVKVDEVLEDYQKDTVLIENFDSFDKIVMDDEFYYSLPLVLQEKLADVHNEIVPLSINSIKNLNNIELCSMLWLADERKNANVRQRR